MTNRALRHTEHTADLCVVGGGIAGMCAAIAAVRHGARVVLMHERPVLGGNASSEIRMSIGGAGGRSNRETGILAEIALDNAWFNPTRNYSLWDGVLYGMVRNEPNITLLLNCTCNDCTMDADRIRSVTGWQLTTQTWHTVAAAYFADCSGDSILAPLSGAMFRIGREAAAEYGESIEPDMADDKTMGLSCLIRARRTDRASTFTPPEWAEVFAEDDPVLHAHPHRRHDGWSTWKYGTNFWWIELGGEQDTIHDAERIRDDLQKAVYGIWDHIKNRGDHDADDLELEWLGSLPGKRESRRYTSDHVLTQSDVETEGRFDDLVAYGGWSMDDHHPAGLRHPGAPTIFHPAPSPYGIPYRCLYSKNVANLFFAGRNISATHAAMSSSRVIATCGVLGQAVGTAAAIASRNGLSPRGVYEQRIDELKQTLMDDDCYLPFNVRRIPELSQPENARITASEGEPEPLRNGLDRPIGESDNGWTGGVGSWVQYDFGRRVEVGGARLVFDADLDGLYHMRVNTPVKPVHDGLPVALVKTFRIEALEDVDGDWRQVGRVTDNRRRMVRIPLHCAAQAVRFIPEETWGADSVHVFAFDVRERRSQ